MYTEEDAAGHPIIGVAIPCRNDAGFLRVCLSALKNQTRPPDFVVVVDNASEDDSPSVARSGGAILFHQPQIGIWPAAAMAYDEVAERGADIIARVDTDSVPPANWIERIENAFLEDPTLGAISGMGDFYGGPPIRRWLGQKFYLGAMSPIMTPWLGHPVVFGSNFAMRTELWLKLRDRVLSDRADIHDDLDLSIRMRPSDNIVFDETLRVGVSARPFATPAALGSRLGKALRTFAASWPEADPIRRRREER